jgi:hypothetical protein
MKAKIIFRIQMCKRSLFEKAYHFIKHCLKNKLRLINSQQPDKGSILDISWELEIFLWQREWLENSRSGTERIKESYCIEKRFLFVERHQD